MVLDLRPLLRSETDCIDIDYKLVPEALPSVEFGEATVVGSVRNYAGYIKLKVSAKVDYRSECARCLAPVSGEFSIDFERTVSDENTLSAQAIEENDGEYAIMHDGFLNIDDEILEELFLQFPSKLLCSDDCQGLCPVCGKPKKDGCNCVTKEIDPRLAVLKNYEFPED